jgi:N-acetylglucosamine-6-phosphate deacetylase
MAGVNRPVKGEIIARDYATGLPLHLVWQQGKILSASPCSREISPELWIAPTLFDLQVNGFAGVDFQQDGIGEEDLKSAVRALRAAGCARFMLTLITDEWVRLLARLQRLRDLRSRSAELQSAIAGWHIEGPFLSAEPGYRGAHDPRWMQDPTAESIAALRSATADDPVLLTLAPERPGAIEAIRMAVSLGMKVSLGHTNAPSDLLLEAVQSGASGFTHLGNGCPSELNRQDNILWRVLDTPGLRPSLIPDGFHVSPSLFRLVHRLLGKDALLYTTDAMAGAGAPPGRYRLASLELEVGPDQIVRLPGTANFAGSALQPLEGVRRAARMLGVSWRDIWRNFSESPAAHVGLVNRLEAGQPDDFCLLRSAGPESLEICDLPIGDRS